MTKRVSKFSYEELCDMWGNCKDRLLDLSIPEVNYWYVMITDRFENDRFYGEQYYNWFSECDFEYGWEND